MTDAPPNLNRRPGVWRWTGLIVGTGVFAAWVTSLFATIGWTNYQSVSTISCIATTRGCIDLVWGGKPLPGGTMEWVTVPAATLDDVVWWPRYERPGPFTTLMVPLWIPLLLVGTPTAWAWWRYLSPRRGSAACRGCGYDLSGLESGLPCPECGRERFSR